MCWLDKKKAAEYLDVCTSTIEDVESAGLLERHRVYLGRKKPVVRYLQSDLDDPFLKRPREENPAFWKQIRISAESHV